MTTANALSAMIKSDAVATMDDAATTAGLPTYTELQALLRRAHPYVRAEYGKMLNQAASYPEATLAQVMKEPTWQRIEGDHKAVDAAIKAAP